MNHSAQRGLALVAVLWVLVLLALVAASFTRTTRTEINLARNLVENAQAEALADAGVHLAILALLDPDPAKRPRADGTPYRIAFGGAEITVSVQDEGGKIDLNAATDELLRGLFVSVGVEAEEADALVDAIADFRDADDLVRLNGAEDRDYAAAGLPWDAKDGPFEAVEELQQVIGMTGEIYDRIVPFVTVHSKRAKIDALKAPAQVLLALPGVDQNAVDTLLDARAAVEGPFPRGPLPLPEVKRGTFALSDGRVHTIRSEAKTPEGAVFVREAVVEVTKRQFGDFQFLTWKQGKRRANDEDDPDSAETPEDDAQEK